MKSHMFFCLCLTAVLATQFQTTPLRNAARIVSGKEARDGQFPWQVGFYASTSGSFWFCGGSIISEYWILTAAHCVEGVKNGTAIAGKVRLDDPLAERVEAFDFVANENHNATLVSNDIGLIRLGRPLSFSENIQPIRLADQPLGEGVAVTASGWGITGDNKPMSSVLNFVELYTLTNVECQDRFAHDKILQDMVCADSDDGESTCTGDSGGPLVTNPEKDPVLVGVISFVSDQGCQAGNPSGYTRTAYFRGWIREKTGI